MLATYVKRSTLIGSCLLVLSIRAFGQGQESSRVADVAVIKKQAQAVIDAVSPTIVRVAYGKEPRRSFGCGVIVTADGHVAFSGPVHAVVDNDLLDVRFADGRRVRAQALGWSSEFGFGMLKITDRGPWPHVKVSDHAHVGDVCIALGFPRNSQWKAEALHPDVRIGLVTHSAPGQWLATSYRSQFNAHPVFDVDGKLLGLNCATPAAGDPLHASAALITTQWDALVAGKNLDRLRLLSQKPVTMVRPKPDEEVPATIIAKAKAASVRISDMRDKTSLVSGVIVSSDGYVITCGHHGRMPKEKLRLSLYDGRTTVATIVGNNPISDVAVLKITEKGTWPHSEMGHSAAMQVGESCVVVGYPRAKPGKDPLTLQTRMIKPTQTLLRRDEFYFEFWTSGFPESSEGASGGGVFNTLGQVVGVVRGGVDQEMKHSRVELFHKNWKSLTASKPVQIIAPSLVDDTSATLNRVAVELSGKD